MTTATITNVPQAAKTIRLAVHHKVDRSDGERRTGMDRRDHQMTAAEVEARLDLWATDWPLEAPRR